MQRRIKQADRDGQIIHRLEDADEVIALQWQQLGIHRFAVLGSFGEHEAFDEDAAIAEEHVLGPAQADALSAESACTSRVGDRVGIRANAQTPHLIGVLQDPIDRHDQFGGLFVGRLDRGCQPGLEVGDHR